MRPLTILGVTGSIGRQTLEVAARLGLEVAAVAAYRPSTELAEIAAHLPAADLAVAGGTVAERSEFDDLMRGRPVQYGPGAVTALAARPGQVVVNGVVGAAGLEPTLAGLEAGNRVALANKESLVAAGDLVMKTLQAGSGELIPVDSEHSALHQCLAGEHLDDVARILLTASGGPFRGWSADETAAVTPEQALAHPTWDMGGRITVDSATLINKGLEVIEAHHLFGVDFDRIHVVVHPGSIVHSAVEFVDGSLKAHLGYPDMRIPIQYALTYPRRAPAPGKRFELEGRQLTFEEVDRTTFPALDLAYAAGRRGRGAPAALNAADEVAVAAFLDGRLPFPGIVDVVASVVEQLDGWPASTLEEVLAADAEARRLAAERIATDKSSRGVI
ncbi:MAG TPA: 1-deoxy-D-xylulose-5-phosphate reductoisomerase [Acidimicrobiia bacterium]|nr:1-deoxy-D-xylulose-5-phosphate reductoisomerase [Acidimicrobiia bacterium]